MWSLYTVYVEVLIDVLVMGLAVLMESHLVLMMDLIWDIMMAPGVVSVSVNMSKIDLV